MAPNQQRRYWIAAAGVVVLAVLVIIGVVFLRSPPLERESADIEAEMLTALEGLSIVEVFTPTPDCPERYPHFESASLSEIVDVVNRCTNSTIVVGDEVLDRVRMSASFDATDLESFLYLLEGSQLVSAHEQPDGTIVLRSIDQP